MDELITRQCGVKGSKRKRMFPCRVFFALPIVTLPANLRQTLSVILSPDAGIVGSVACDTARIQEPNILIASFVSP